MCKWEIKELLVLRKEFLGNWFLHYAELHPCVSADVVRQRNVRKTLTKHLFYLTARNSVGKGAYGECEFAVDNPSNNASAFESPPCRSEVNTHTRVRRELDVLELQSR